MLNMTYDNDIHTHTYGYSAHGTSRAAEQHAPHTRVCECMAHCTLRTHADACAGMLARRWRAKWHGLRCLTCAPSSISKHHGKLENGSLDEESGLQHDDDG